MSEKNDTIEIKLDNNIETIAICTDASCSTRSLPEETWIEIAKQELKNKNIIFVGNNEEIDKTLFEEKYHSRIFDYGMKLEITQVAFLLSKCEYVYTPDTGIFHLASLIGTPCKAFFGPIDPKLRDGYYKVENIILYKGDEMKCVPCKDVGCKTRKCMVYTKEEISDLVKRNV